MKKHEQITSYDIQAIRARLPHRYPFLMIDNIEESGCGYAVATKNVTINEPYFQGHFPDYPIVPGVLLTESCLQASAFMGTANDENEKMPDYSKMRLFCVSFNMKFSDIAQPGDQLRVEVRLAKRLGAMIRVKARISKKNKLIASGDLSLAYQLKD